MSLEEKNRDQKGRKGEGRKKMESIFIFLFDNKIKKWVEEENVN